ncbi:phosphate signaling complex protein PhoU [Williamwhitmania taraxaci]|uniref:Phosphate-specific transport system accessory protein PhoU n=1 Tax=Williamwhitmania taraxaci TaxID=1640674 RepID=A0A1G6IJW8_9BACT|nr:phosphate signaling complex protein PhoU [Williamwhitmania taraxaci]SDC06778.1 phosphate transport system protein [Williamwhitmania taraxaci]
MTHLDTELIKLKQELFEMWSLVISQVETSREAIMNYDKGAASEIAFKERMVDSYELRLDRDCENIIALYNPVATDLRLTLAILKINTDLERIGDFARGLAKFVQKCNKESLNPKLLEVCQIDDLIKNAVGMLTDAKKAFEFENSRMAISIFSHDDFIDEVQKKANKIIADYIIKNPEEIDEALNMLINIRKVERIGDHCSNIAEAIVFYLDAKVLKHSGKKKSE